MNDEVTPGEPPKEVAPDEPPKEEIKERPRSKILASVPQEGLNDRIDVLAERVVGFALIAMTERDCTPEEKIKHGRDTIVKTGIISDLPMMDVRNHAEMLRVYTEYVKGMTRGQLYIPGGGGMKMLGRQPFKPPVKPIRRR
jgi:hypothetical protein